MASNVPPPGIHTSEQSSQPAPKRKSKTDQKASEAATGTLPKSRIPSSRGGGDTITSRQKIKGAAPLPQPARLPTQRTPQKKSKAPAKKAPPPSKEKKPPSSKFVTEEEGEKLAAAAKANKGPQVVKGIALKPDLRGTISQEEFEQIEEEEEKDSEKQEDNLPQRERTPSKTSKERLQEIKERKREESVTSSSSAASSEESKPTEKVSVIQSLENQIKELEELLSTENLENREEAETELAELKEQRAKIETRQKEIEQAIEEKRKLFREETEESRKGLQQSREKSKSRLQKLKEENDRQLKELASFLEQKQQENQTLKERQKSLAQTIQKTEKAIQQQRLEEEQRKAEEAEKKRLEDLESRTKFRELVESAKKQEEERKKRREERRLKLEQTKKAGPTEQLYKDLEQKLGGMEDISKLLHSATEDLRAGQQEVEARRQQMFLRHQQSSESSDSSEIKPAQSIRSRTYTHLSPESLKQRLHHPHPYTTSKFKLHGNEFEMLDFQATDEEILNLGPQKDLFGIDFSSRFFFGIKDHNLLSLSQILRDEDIERARFFKCPYVTDKGLQALFKFSQLKHFATDTHVAENADGGRTPQVICEIIRRNSAHLQSVELPGIEVTEDLCVELAHCPNLQYLDLKEARVILPQLYGICGLYEDSQIKRSHFKLLIEGRFPAEEMAKFLSKCKKHGIVVYYDPEKLDWPKEEHRKEQLQATIQVASSRQQSTDASKDLSLFQKWKIRPLPPLPEADNDSSQNQQYASTFLTPALLNERLREKRGESDQPQETEKSIVWGTGEEIYDLSYEDVWAAHFSDYTLEDDQTTAFFQKRFKEEQESGKKEFSAVAIFRSPTLTDETLLSLKQFSYLEQLGLDASAKWTCPKIAALIGANSAHLKRIALLGIEITKEILDAIIECVYLEELNLSQANFTFDDLRAICQERYTSLQTIIILGCPFSLEDLQLFEADCKREGIELIYDQKAPEPEAAAHPVEPSTSLSSTNTEEPQQAEQSTASEGPEDPTKSSSSPITPPGTEPRRAPSNRSLMPSSRAHTSSDPTQPANQSTSHGKLQPRAGTPPASSSRTSSAAAATNQQPQVKAVGKSLSDSALLSGDSPGSSSQGTSLSPSKENLVNQKLENMLPGHSQPSTEPPGSPYSPEPPQQKNVSRNLFGNSARAADPEMRRSSDSSLEEKREEASPPPSREEIVQAEADKLQIEDYTEFREFVVQQGLLSESTPVSKQLFGELLPRCSQRTLVVFYQQRLEGYGLNLQKLKGHGINLSRENPKKLEALSQAARRYADPMPILPWPPSWEKIIQIEAQRLPEDYDHAGFREFALQQGLFSESTFVSKQLFRQQLQVIQRNPTAFAALLAFYQRKIQEYDASFSHITDPEKLEALFQAAHNLWHAVDKVLKPKFQGNPTPYEMLTEFCRNREAIKQFKILNLEKRKKDKCLTSIPVCFSQLNWTYLLEFVASGNRLSTLELPRALQLEKLILRDNRMDAESLSESVEHWMGIALIDLQRNGIETFPLKLIGTCCQQKEIQSKKKNRSVVIDLRENPIHIAPRELFSLPIHLARRPPNAVNKLWSTPTADVIVVIDNETILKNWENLKKEEEKKIAI